MPKFLVYENITREIPLLPGEYQAVWESPQAMRRLPKNLAGVEKETRKRRDPFL